MFKYVKAIVILILLLLGAQLVNGYPVQTSTPDSSSISMTTTSTTTTSSTVVLTATSMELPSSYEAFKTSEEYVPFMVHNLWLLCCTFLVFIMHLGFTAVETGFNASKNAVNVIYKNIFTLAAGLMTYAVVGFGLMYPGEFNVIPGWLGFRGFGLGYQPSLVMDFVTTRYHPHYTVFTDFLFQAMFAATSATIISGAVAGRIKMPAYMVYAAVVLVVIYPITGSWKWGGGWLQELGFHDFAGSTLVHLVGAAGCLAAMAGATFIVHKLDATQALNGILGGLVGITAGADVVLPNQAIIIGSLGGLFVVLAVFAIERMGIDDPVSAIAVHGVGGIWGTLAVGIWGLDKSLYPQVMGVVSILLFTLIISTIAIFAIRYTLGLRSDEAVELQGADAAYHGQRAYPES